MQLDIRYYFCRRGGENVHGFDKDTFSLEYDSESKIAFVKKNKDELTKNHRERDNSFITGFMPQMKDVDGHPHRLCPVRSFENYLSHLSPKINNLWQQPAKKYVLDQTFDSQQYLLDTTLWIHSWEGCQKLVICPNTTQIIAFELQELHI